MRLCFTRKVSRLLFVGFITIWGSTCRSQSSMTHEVKIASIITNQVDNVGLLYEFIPNKRIGYELGVLQDNNIRFFFCDGHCDNPNEVYKAYDWRSWTFILSLKYYLSQKHRPSRLYVGSFLLYSTEVKASISEEFRERLKEPIPINYAPDVYVNRLSPGGIVGYKWQLGQHLLLEPSLALGINLNSPYIGTDFETLVTGRIGWRF